MKFLTLEEREITVETRRYGRRIAQKINCIIKNEDGEESIRKVLNVSVGGMLLAKETSDDNIGSVGDIMEFHVVFGDDYGIVLKGKVLRQQERSVAVMFVQMDKQQEKLLKAVCS